MTNLDEKDKEYYVLCEAFIDHQVYEKHIKDIVNEIKEKSNLISGDFVGIGSIDLIKEKWQEGHLPIIMDNGHLYIKFLPFELFCARMTPDEYIKTNKYWANKKFKEINQEIIKGLQEKIDNDDPNIDNEKTKETIEYIKQLTF